MAMTVMHVRYMRMRMSYPAVLVEMGMWLTGRIGGRVLVPMVLIMHVRMGVRHWLVNVLVLVTLGEMKPHADRHQPTGCDKLHCKRFAE